MQLPGYLGRYEVRDEIGRGGFAVVVRAWDEDLHSAVAIKILHSEFVHGNHEVQQTFLEEARLMRRIRSANVVTIHDIGRLADGRPYFLMDFADRGTLADRLISKSFSFRQDAQSLATLVDALADGLSAIHDAGVVHRDIKPANILFQLTRRGAQDPDQTILGDAIGTLPKLVAADERILVSDLGIAKDLSKGNRSASLLAGSAFYQSPEQCEVGVEVTRAADIYSASAIVWQLITAQRPPHPHAVSEALSALPQNWREVLETGMALDPGARFDSMNAWRAAIQEVLSREGAELETVSSTTLQRADQICPYKGLASYQPEDESRFHGREALIDELVRRIQLRKVLIVGGPSGSGKSSLVRAGVIPALRAGAVMGSESWRIVLLNPGRDPMTALYFHLTQASPDAARTVSLEDFIGRPTLARHLADAAQPAVICIDQFEELFTLASPSQRNKVLEALSAMTESAHSTVHLVLAVRADFYGVCAQIPWLAACITANRFLLAR